MGLGGLLILLGSRLIILSFDIYTFGIEWREAGHNLVSVFADLQADAAGGTGLVAGVQKGPAVARKAAFWAPSLKHVPILALKTAITQYFIEVFLALGKNISNGLPQALVFKAATDFKSPS